MSLATRLRSLLGIAAFAGALVTAAVASSPAADAAPAAPATCTPARLIVAKGTLEPGTLGVIVGDPLRRALETEAPDAFTYQALDYPATPVASSPPAGDRALVKAVADALRQCPRQKIVLSGYSQGAQVVDLALGIDTTGSINGIPPVATFTRAQARSIAAIVQFGNPIGSIGKTVASAAPSYGSRTKEYCADGDPVCQPDGANILAHLTYFADVDAAAGFVVGRL